MLPIDPFLADIKNKLTHHNSLVLQAEPGAGKSTAVPLSLIGADFLQGRKIIMLEPRRVSAKSIAHYLARSLGEKVGQRIGYQIRSDRKISSNTQLEIVTEGILTKRLQHDPELSDVGLIIFDEFHERSIHADLALMLSLEVQDAYREDLKLLVMSATLDTDLVANYVNTQQILKCPGKCFPVDVAYQEGRDYLPSQVINALTNVLNQPETGDILIFLPGQGDIKKCISFAQEKFNPSHKLSFLPLYGALSLEQQEKVLQRDNIPNQPRKIIFSTNIAETSLTIEGITTVIDSGLEKVIAFDPKSGMTKLVTQKISKASATQRAGRAGRIQAGRCIRLWSESSHRHLKDYQEEEIINADLSDLILELSAWGVNKYEDINWLTPPPRRHFDIAMQLLEKINLVNSNHVISAYGKAALKMGVQPRLSSMILQCKDGVEQQVALLTAGIISEKDIFFNHHNTNVLDRVIAAYDYLTDKSSAKNLYQINVSAMDQGLTLARSFAKSLGSSLNINLFTTSDIHDCLGYVLLKAFPERLAKLRNNSSGKYLLANGRGVSLLETDSLQGEPWLVVCDCDGQNKDGRIYTCTPVSFEQIKNSLSTSFYDETFYELNAKKDNVRGKRCTKYMSLTLNEELLEHIPSHEFEQCVQGIIKKYGLSFLNWTKKCEAWLARTAWLGEHIEAFPKLSEQTLLDTVDEWLMPYLSNVKSVKQLTSFNLYDLLVANLSWEQQNELAQQAPEYYVTPSDKKVRVRYDEFQGPTVAVVLQEMFGQLTSPCLANGKVPIRFELLSPAQRPIQTTSDLANFWQSSYFAVAKEMRGKYIKHRWPDKPLDEKPGRSIKRK